MNVKKFIILATLVYIGVGAFFLFGYYPYKQCGIIQADAIGESFAKIEVTSADKDFDIGIISLTPLNKFDSAPYNREPESFVVKIILYMNDLTIQGYTEVGLDSVTRFDFLNGSVTIYLSQNSEPIGFVNTAEVAASIILTLCIGSFILIPVLVTQVEWKQRRFI